jgi:hypothetical protein
MAGIHGFSPLRLQGASTAYALVRRSQFAFALYELPPTTARDFSVMNTTGQAGTIGAHTQLTGARIPSANTGPSRRPTEFPLQQRNLSFCQVRVSRTDPAAGTLLGYAAGCTPCHAPFRRRERAAVRGVAESGSTYSRARLRRAAGTARRTPARHAAFGRSGAPPPRRGRGEP